MIYCSSALLQNVILAYEKKKKRPRLTIKVYEILPVFVENEKKLKPKISSLGLCLNAQGKKR